MQWRQMITAICTLLVKQKQRILYKGVDISGQWYADYHIIKEIEKNGQKTKQKVKTKELTLSITQNAYNLHGDLVIKNIKNEIESFSFYKHHGTIRDNYLTLNYLPKSNKTIGLGSIVLIVRNGGNNLKGNLIGTILSTMELVCVDNLNFIRKQ